MASIGTFRSKGYAIGDLTLRTYTDVADGCLGEGCMGCMHVRHFVMSFAGRKWRRQTRFARDP